MKTLKQILESVLNKDLNVEISDFRTEEREYKKELSWLAKLTEDKAAYYEAAYFLVVNNIFNATEQNKLDYDQWASFLMFLKVARDLMPYECSNFYEVEDIEDREYSTKGSMGAKEFEAKITEMLQCHPTDKKVSAGSSSFREYILDADYFAFYGDAYNKPWTRQFERLLQETLKKHGVPT